MNPALIASERLSTDAIRAQVARLRNRYKQSPTAAALADLTNWMEAVITRMGSGHVCPRCKIAIVNTPDPRNCCGACLTEAEAQRERCRPQRAD